MPPDTSALRVFIDSVLLTHGGRCLDRPEERDAVAVDLVEVLVEYLRSMKPEDQQA